MNKDFIVCEETIDMEIQGSLRLIEIEVTQNSCSHMVVLVDILKNVEIDQT